MRDRVPHERSARTGAPRRSGRSRREHAPARHAASGAGCGGAVSPCPVRGRGAGGSRVRRGLLGDCVSLGRARDRLGAGGGHAPARRGARAAPVLRRVGRAERGGLARATRGARQGRSRDRCTLARASRRGHDPGRRSGAEREHLRGVVMDRPPRADRARGSGAVRGRRGHDGARVQRANRGSAQRVPADDLAVRALDPDQRTGLEAENRRRRRARRRQSFASSELAVLVTGRRS